MSMFGGMEISATALTAQRLRMNVTAENLANANSTKGADGGSVDIDAESAKLAANALDQQAAVSVAKTRNAILRSAMGVA